MVYIESFRLPIDKEAGLIERRKRENGGLHGYIDNIYPAGLFSEKSFSEINFADITIFYGGNGSGKSTLLNLIAQKLELDRIAPFNNSELFKIYVDACQYAMGYSDEGFKFRIPNGSRIITSDDVFDYMLAIRGNNQEIAESIEEAKDDYARLKYGNTLKFSGMQDYEEHRAQVLARSKSTSRRQFIRKIAGSEVALHSNGETALTYFDSHLDSKTLYCLDEPENSLSPKLQLELVDILKDVARAKTQLIIATHSPFILSIPGARIYDLDEIPVDIRNWWELENTRIYFKFFDENRELFKI